MQENAGDDALSLNNRPPSKSLSDTGYRLFTVKEAACYLAVSVATVYGWVWQRRIPFVKIGRAVRFDPRDLEAFIEASKQGYNTRAAGKG